MKAIHDSTDVLGLLMNPTVQKEVARVAPKFSIVDLMMSILDEWPGGYKGFAKDIYKEYEAAPAGSPTRKDIIKMMTAVISDVSAKAINRPVTEMTEDELKRAVLSIAPALQSFVEKTS